MAEELHTFSCFSQQNDKNDQLEKYVSSLWEEGTSRPEWCFIAVKDAKIVGRIAYWAPLPGADPTDIDFFDVDWMDEAYAQIAVILLHQSLIRLHLAHDHQMKYQLNSPNRLQPVTEQRLQVLAVAGFSLRRKGYRWQTTDTTPREERQDLHYQVVRAEEDRLQESIKCTLAQSLDRGIQSDLATLGPEGGARKHLASSQTLHLLPNGWQIASLADGTVVGIIMVARNDGGFIIDYLGIVPEQRGHGYVHSLLAHGVNTLLKHGAKRIRSDCDVNNAPMIRAFQQAGFTTFSARSVYYIKIP